MSSNLNVTPDLYWVGSLDPHLRNFDIVMETAFGTTYNAYLLKTSQGIVLFETVKDKCFEDYFKKLKQLTDLKEVKYVVVNHTEPDHAGSVAKLLKQLPNVTVIGSSLAIKYLSQIINAPFSHMIVKDNETLSLGNKTLKFISVPQLHWPDTMYTYIPEEQVLITCDSFGAHYSDPRLFRKALTPSESTDYDSAYRYYYDMIMGPFKPFVLKALDKISELPLDFICPGHGMILDTTHIPHYLSLYRTWSTQKAMPNKIVIAYVSAYGYTLEIAETLSKGIAQSTYHGEVILLDMEQTPLEEALSHINTCQGLLIGSPTILADALPPIWAILTSLNPTVHKHLTVGVFGSYGWSGEALNHIEQRFAQLKCKMPLPPLGCVFKADSDFLEKATAYGKSFAESLL